MAGRPRKVPPVPVLPGQKFCFQCMTAKPVEAFATDRAQWDQRRTICGTCDDKRRMAHYHARRRWKETKARIEASLGKKSRDITPIYSPPKKTRDARAVQ